MRLRARLVALSVLLSLAATADTAADLRARGDALDEAGNLDGALQAFKEAQAAGDRSAEIWMRVGSTLRNLRRFGEAASALKNAVAANPNDQEAKDALTDLRRSRGLRVNAWLGGDEPGTSKQAVNFELWYGGLDRLEVKAGYGYSDLVFFQSNTAFVTAYWFYAPTSYVQADFTYRKFAYLTDPALGAPNPDTSSYDDAPRGTLEIQHWFGGLLRARLTYQLFVPTFWHDPSTRIVNHKLVAEVAVRLPFGLRAGVLAGGLRDPDPRATRIINRPDPTATGASSPTVVMATETSVRYRIEPLLGFFMGWDRARWGLEIRGLTNRELDASFAFSVIIGAALKPLEKLELMVSWIHDSYSDVSVFRGHTGEAVWVSGRYWLLPSLAIGGGAKWVNNPSPQSPTDPSRRNSVTLLINLEYRSSLL